MELPRTWAYELSLEDIHAFDAHYAVTAAAPKRARRAVRLVLTLLLASLLSALGAWIRAPLSFWVVGAVIIAAWWAVFPYRVGALMRANTERTYREGKNLGLLGPHRVTIDAEWLIEATAERETRTKWRAVERVDETPTHWFVYESSFSAVVVPKRVFGSVEESAEFAATCRRLLGGGGEAHGPAADA